MATSPTVRRRRLAGELRRLREAANLTVEEAAETAEISKSSLSRIENAISAVRGPIMRALLRAYQISGDDERRFLALAKDASQPGWWQTYSDFLDETATFISFENDAVSVQIYEVMVLPGIVQTAEYATAIQVPFRTEKWDVERRVAARMERQRRLEDLKIWTVLEENIITRPTGGPAAMQRQLERLISISEQRNVILQIIPHALGAHTGIDGPFSIFQFADARDPDIAYSEGQLGHLWVDDKDKVQRAHEHFDHLRAAALDPDASRERIQVAARNFRDAL